MAMKNLKGKNERGVNTNDRSDAIHRRERESFVFRAAALIVIRKKITL